MHTILYLIRHGATDWTRDRRLAGRRELGLSLEGRVQADELAERLAPLDLAEVLSSPLPRAIETAERIATRHRIDVARDPRLTDLHAGKWEGAALADLSQRDEFRRFLDDPIASPIPGGEALTDVRDRMLASTMQALVDNELGAHIAVISHAGPLRILIAHYLGMELASFHRLRLQPASVTALRFESETQKPRLLTLNCLGDVRPATLD
jgi:broad specificity phosphatase PhoE